MGDAVQSTVGHESLQAIFEPRRTLKVIAIGAGASGLLLAYKLQRHFGDFSLQIFEKNPEISGTWYENRYPG
jgi:cyclohexanone monooxygenase